MYTYEMGLLKSKKVLLFIFLVSSFLGMVVFAVMKMNEAFEDDYKLLRAIEVGMTEQQVIEKLGPPHDMYTRDNAPVDYYVKGWSFKNRAITKKVLIYHFNEPSPTTTLMTTTRSKMFSLAEASLVLSHNECRC